VSRRRAAAAFTLAGAAWGLGCGVALATLWFAPPHTGQLPGALLLYGVDAHAPLRMMLTVMLAPLAGAAVGRALARWQQPAMIAALLAGLWLAIVDPFDVVAVLFVPIVLIAAIWLLRRGAPPSSAAGTAASTPPRDRRRDGAEPAGRTPALQRRDVALVPAALVVFALLAPLMPWPVAAVAAAAIVIAVRIAFSKPWMSRRTLALVAYPLFAFALGLHVRQPRLNLFEDGHSLTPANEMMRGERPYRDIVPVHGLIADGLLDATAMALGARDAGAVLRFRIPFAALLPLAVYAVALAATGSAEAAILALLAAACLTITGTPWSVPVTALESLPPIRAVPSLFSLALAASAVRRRAPRALGWAGVVAVLACFTSIEFGIYAFAGLLAASIRLRDWKRPLAGTAAAGIMAAIALAIAGALPAFVRVMLFEIPPLTDAYSVAVFAFPPAFASMRGLPDILAGLFVQRTVWIVAWGAIAIGTSAALVSSRRSRIIDPLVPVGAWVMAAALSFAERTNVYFMPAAIVIAVAIIAALRRHRLVFVIALIAIVAPSQQLGRLAAALRAPATPPGYVAYDALPRARGVWVERANAETLDAAQAFIARALRPGETFFDFANMPALYYFFDLRCPIRQYETPLYESERLQREVIARLERDRSVRAALMQYPNQGVTSIDGVPNAVRAPLVFAWLRQHFVPAYQSRGVVFWVRRD
jgi:hypothetical protein